MGALQGNQPSAESPAVPAPVGLPGKEDEQIHFNVRFQVLMEASMKFRVFWDVAPCREVDFDRRFRDADCRHHQGQRSKLSLLSFLGQLRLPVRSVATRPPLISIIPVPAKSLKRADFYPISLFTLYLTLSLFYLGLPHLPLVLFLTYCHPFPIG
jgi:hypothetical protein